MSAKTPPSATDRHNVSNVGCTFFQVIVRFSFKLSLSWTQRDRNSSNNKNFVRRFGQLIVENDVVEKVFDDLQPLKISWKVIFHGKNVAVVEFESRKYCSVLLTPSAVIAWSWTKQQWRNSLWRHSEPIDIKTCEKLLNRCTTHQASKWNCDLKQLKKIKTFWTADPSHWF